MVQQISLTFDESVAFLNQAVGQMLSQEQIAVLARAAEGWMIGLQLAVLALHNQQDASQVFEAFTQAITFNQSVENTCIVINIVNSLGALYASAGQLRRAAELCRQAIELATISLERDGPVLLMAGKAHISLSAVLYEWNDLASAESHATQGLELCKQWGHLEQRSDGYLALAAIKQASSDWEGAYALLLTARSELQQARQSLQNADLRSTFQRVDDRVAAALAALWLAQGRIDAAQRWAQERGIADHDAGQTGYTLLASLLLAQGKSAQALTLIERLQRAQQEQGGVINLMILQAMALHAQGRTGQAITTFAQALRLAELQGYVRTFLDKGQTLHVLLRLASKERPTIHYAIWLLSIIGGYNATSELPPLNEVFDQREREILQFLANGLPNRAIAETLMIPTGTVKWYLNGIYNKLNVHSRTQAIVRARELRLII